MAQKYSKEICTLDHTGEVPQHLLDSLPINQGAPVRHRCAACAYKAGKLESAQQIDKLVAQVEHLRKENARLKQRDVGTVIAEESLDTDRIDEDELDEGGDWAPNLIDSYPDSEFRNLTRSTIAMLAFWREPKATLRSLAEHLDAPDLVDATITPEFATPSPGGKASFTDLMVESAGTALGIEAKRTELRYPSVGSWCTRDSRRRVLKHWRTLIQPRTMMPEDARLDSLVYQMVHRTASVCARPAARAIVLYQIFDDTHVDEYEQDLRRLVEVIRPTSALEVWLHIVPTEETIHYSTIASRMGSLSRAEAAATIRRAIANGELFRFAETAPRQLTTVMRY
ncbi:MAG: hypothetical protein R3B48_15550 [Kofleriaceae bacterium]